MRYWLMKSEPFKYSWDDLVAEEEGTWDGVRNHRAKNNLAAMEVGDQVFFYHSREGLEIVGICEVSVAGIRGGPTGRRALVAGGHARGRGRAALAARAGRAALGARAARPVRRALLRPRRG